MPDYFLSLAGHTVARLIIFFGYLKVIFFVSSQYVNLICFPVMLLCLSLDAWGHVS